MPKKRFNAEQIVTLLRQIEVLMAQGKSAPEACRDAGISQHFRKIRCGDWHSPLDTAKRQTKSNSREG
jgi:hypothetical protein